MRTFHHLVNSSLPKGKEVASRVAAVFFRFLYMRIQRDLHITGNFEFSLSQLKEVKELIFTEYLLSAWHYVKCV